MKLIPLTQGRLALVDDSDFQWLSQFKWSTIARPTRRCRFYAIRSGRVDGKRTTIYMHRMILGLGRADHRQCDHINGDGVDNRRSNLRICNHAENSRNTFVRKDSRSGFKGVRLYQRKPTHTPKWVADICVDGKTTRIGSYFTCPEDAAEAYNEAAIKLHGEFAKLNNVALLKCSH